ncbi:MAG: cation diffusion facilitator family transporter [Flavipsychrobacter sp.]|nr:cation diffusion facilitator family transporter [Flavipsychrobacter sp.]
MHNHDHSHEGHHHHHQVTPADVANKAFVAGIILNSVYVVAQAVAGFMTGSMALLSDAGHNLSDVASLALSLIAFKLAKVKATDTFTYGYKKSTILAGLTNAVILLIAIGLLGFESISRIFHPQPIEGGIVAIVASIGIAVNFGSAMFFYKNKDHDINTKGAYLHLLTDALVSLGVVVAGIVIKYTNWYWLDGAVSVAILIVILVGTWSLLTDSLRMSVDAVPANVEVASIEQLILKVKGVESIHHMHIWPMSTTENALTTHLVLNEQLTFDEKMKLVHKIKHELMHNNIHHSTIELESANRPCEETDCLSADE